MNNRQRRRPRFSFLAATSLVLLAALTRVAVSRSPSPPLPQKTVDDRLREYGAAADARWRPLFDAQNVSYPPRRVTFVGLKEEKVLQLYAANAGGPWKLIKTYPVLAASGAAGPKLRQGDLQVPEGFYQISLLNPNSLFHLSLRVNYPNDFDRRMAARDGRTNLGGDIMIHGNAVSVGCLAVGDPAAEDLFVLAARAGLDRLAVILAPVDLRIRPAPPATESTPPWVAGLYEDLRREMKRYPLGNR